MAEERNIRHLIQAIFETRGWQEYTRRITDAGKVMEKYSTTYRKKTGEIVRATRQIKDGQESLTVTTRKGVSVQNDFIKALRRVAIVVPVWFAFRRVMMSVVTTIQEGARYLYEMNKAFTKASLVVHTLEDIDKVNDNLQKGFEDLALKVGESSTEIAKAFYRFGTLGIEASKAWAGAQASIKQAVATMGDIDTIAKANALAISLLGDTLGDYLPLNERLNFFTAKQVVLWKTNLMESNEFAMALERFLPTAKTLNLTLDQTVALLATLHSAGIRGSKAGRLLRTTFLRLIQNLPRVGKELKVLVKAGDDTFTTLMNILDEFYDRWKKTGGKLSPELNRLFRQIFGGVRSQEVARALSVMYKVLKKNIDLINAQGIPTQEKINRIMKEYEAQLNKVTNAYFKLIEKNRELRRQIGEELVKAFQSLIASDPTEAMERLNKILTTLLATLRVLKKHSKEVTIVFGLLVGTTIPAMIQKINILRKSILSLQAVLIATGGNLKSVFSFLLKTPIGLAITAFTTVLYGLGKYEEKVKGVSKSNRVFASSTKSASEAIKSLIDKFKELKSPEELAEAKSQIEELMKVLDSLKETAKGAPLAERTRIYESLSTLYRIVGDLGKEYQKRKGEFEKQGIKIGGAVVSPELEEQLRLLDKSVKYVEMQAAGYSSMEITQEKLNDYIDEMVNQYNKVLRIQKEKGNEEAKSLEYVSREQILTLLMRKEYDKIKELLNLQDDSEEKILKMRQLQRDVLKEQIKLIQSYADEIRSTFQSALTDLLKTGQINKFFDTLKEKFSSLYYETIAKKVTSLLSQSTGIFKTLGEQFAKIEFGSIGAPILTASELGSRKYYDAIVRASEAGSKLYAGASATTGTAGGGLYTPTGYYPGGYAPKRRIYVPETKGWIEVGYRDVVGSYNPFQLPIAAPYYAGYGTPTITTPSGGWDVYRQIAYSHAPLWKKSAGSFWGNQTYGQVAGQIGMGALLGGLGSRSWQGAVGGAFTGLGIALAASHPFLAMASIFVGSLISATKKHTETVTRQQSVQVASRIDVTNKQLEIVNRNLVALRSDIRTYLLPESAYFSEKRNIEDEFSINSRRGLTG